MKLTSHANDSTHVSEAELRAGVAQALLEGLIDYAGLFPPAECEMEAAIRNFASYRDEQDHWMLGRFICSANSLNEFRDTFAQQPQQREPKQQAQQREDEPWRLTVVASGQTLANVAADMAAIEHFNTECRKDNLPAIADCYEIRCPTREDVIAFAAEIPRELTTYIELPLADSEVTDRFIAEVSGAGRRAKIRMGGVTAGAFPDATAVVGFLQSCITHNVVAKATAGLHHPIGGVYRLTYDEQADAGGMFGFLNLFLTAAILASGATTDTALALLLEPDTAKLEINPRQISWRRGNEEWTFDNALLSRVRQTLLVSFGSCSFLEPVSESRALRLLPHLESRPA